MAELSSNFRLRFGLREVFYAFLCVILGYLLRVKDSYSMNPVWRKRSELSKFSNAKFPTQEDHVPKPIITDLEGDGVNEIVLISNDFVHLNVLAVPLNSEEEDKSLAHVVGKHKTELVLHQRITGFTPKPYVVAVGFTTPYLSMMQIRKQVIVVVTNDWQVLCYDSDLTLLWRQQLPLPRDDFSDIEVKSLTVKISPLSIDKNHQGLVIIGGNFKHKSHQADFYQAMKEREKMDPKNRTVDIQTEYEVENLTHFSTFALSAKDGSVLWKHVAGDYQHTAADPHVWADNSDTEILVARINKDFDRKGQSQEEEGVSTPASALLSEHFLGFSYGGQRPHSDDEHVHNPNSLVIRSPEGLQVLSLVTGQPKAMQRFPPDRALYYDVDGDGHVEKMIWDIGQHYSPCFLDIWRLHPVHEKLDQIMMCSNKRLFWVRSWSVEEDVYHKIPPKMIKSVARKTGILRHFLGHNLFEDKGHDIISFGGMGRLSSFGVDGSMHWQTATNSKWSEMSLILRKSGGPPKSDDLKQEFLLSFQPDRMLMPLVVAGPQVAVAVSGANSITLVDLTDGTILAEHSLPAYPTAPLAYGDFDNDGLMDIIATCKKGYIGFALKLKHNYELTVLYTAAVFLIIILFSWIVSSTTYKDDDSSTAEDEDVDDEIVDNTLLDRVNNRNILFDNDNMIGNLHTS